MKKALLLVVALLPLLVAAQSRLTVRTPKVPQRAVSGWQIHRNPITGAEVRVAGTSQPSSLAKVAASPHGVEAGISSYDLQTNGSVSRRIHTYRTNDSLRVYWTMSQSVDPYTDRGTGTNFWTGSFGPAPTVRLESQRTGWPTGVRLNDGTELVASHDPATGSERIRFYKNTGVGTNNFTELTTNYPADRAIWPRLANSGNYLYIVSNHQDTGFVNTNIPGVKSPMYCYRSTDAGSTWNQTFLPGYDSARYVNGGGDTYAIDARDNFVAIVAGGYYEDIALWKSTDFGVTFTKTLVDSFEIPGLWNMNNRTSDVYDGTGMPGTDGNPDTLTFGDGSVEVLIDPNGAAHVWYGLSRGVKPNISADSAFFFPGTSGIVYWNEVSNAPQVIADIVDCDGDTTVFNLAAGTTEGTATGQGGRYRLSSLTSMPSAGLDAAGNIFCIYTAVNEIDTTSANMPTFNGVTQNFRDILVVYSTDAGNTWSTPQNLTNNQANTYQQNEEVFASLAKNIGNTLNFAWQWDVEPGTVLQNGDDAGINSMRVGSVLVSDVLSNKYVGGCGPANDYVVQGPFTTIPVNVQAEVNTFASVVYPNPTSGILNISFELNQSTQAVISVSNLMGQELMKVSGNQFNAGVNEAKLDLSALNAGIYLYTIRAEGKSFTGRVIVSK